MALYRTRKRALKKADRVAGGELLPLVRTFSEDVRTRIRWAMLHAGPPKDSYGVLPGHDDVDAALRVILLSEWGRTSLVNPRWEPSADLSGYIVNHAGHDEMLDIIEAWFLAFAKVLLGSQFPIGFRLSAQHENDHFNQFRDHVNRIFDEHDMAYQVVGFQVVERDSMVMHADVVAPALALLHGDRRFADAERAFQKALHELKPKGDPSDAITDAATALEETLRALGCKGNALGPLLSDAKKRGILGPYDSKLAQGVLSIGEWVSADRSTRGDAHAATRSEVDDAWLAVHVVGALIVRLTARQP